MGLIGEKWEGDGIILRLFNNILQYRYTLQKKGYALTKFLHSVKWNMPKVKRFLMLLMKDKARKKRKPWLCWTDGQK